MSQLSDGSAQWQRIARDACLQALASNSAFLVAIPPGYFAAEYVPLLPEERARHDRFRLEHDRKAFRSARGLVRSLLCAGETPAPFELGDNGKPFLTGKDAFNISHSRDVVALAITRAAYVGVDVEQLDRIDEPEKLLDMVCHPRERAWVLAKEPGDARSHAFLTCWTRKEAVLKAAGIGLIDDLPTIDVQLDQDHPVLQNPVPVKIYSFPVPLADAICSIALPHDVRQVEILIAGQERPSVISV